MQQDTNSIAQDIAIFQERSAVVTWKFCQTSPSGAKWDSEMLHVMPSTWTPVALAFFAA